MGENGSFPPKTQVGFSMLSPGPTLNPTNSSCPHEAAMPKQCIPCQVLICCLARGLWINVSLEWQVAQCGELKKLSQAFCLVAPERARWLVSSPAGAIGENLAGVLILTASAPTAGLSQKYGLDVGCQCLCQDTKDTGFINWIK